MNRLLKNIKEYGLMELKKAVLKSIFMSKMLLNLRMQQHLTIFQALEKNTNIQLPTLIGEVERVEPNLSPEKNGNGRRFLILGEEI